MSWIWNFEEMEQILPTTEAAKTKSLYQKGQFSLMKILRQKLYEPKKTIKQLIIKKLEH